LFTETLTQREAIANGVTPQILNNAILNTGGVDMEASRRAIFTLQIGAVVSGGSISAWLQESADNSTWTANGTAGAFSNSGGTGVSQTGITTAQSYVTFEVNAEQLTPGKRYVRLQIKETGSQNVYVAVLAVGDEGVHKPNNANNGTDVLSQNVVF
jgi:hypothetical protein